MRQFSEMRGGRAMRIGAMALTGLWCAMPALAENPSSHQRQPQRYQDSPLVTPAPAKKPSDMTVFDDPENRRSGLAPIERVKKPSDDDGKREMVGKEKLWTTRDPPGKRGVFAFLGNKIGDPIENVFPDPQEKDQFGMPLCRDTAGLPGWLECTDDSIREMVNGAWKLLYRGIEVGFVNYRYLDGKLVGFRMGFPAANFQKLGEALKSQYGPATGEEATSWQHRLGGVIDIKLQTWNTPDGEMTLKSRGAALDAGILTLLEPKAEARYNDLRFKQVVVPPRPSSLSDEGFVIHPVKAMPDSAGGKAAADKPQAGPAAKAPVE